MTQKKEFSCLNCRVCKDRRKVCVNYQINIDDIYNVVYRNRNSVYLKDSKMHLKVTKYEKLLSKRVFFWAILTYFSSSGLYWMKQVFIFKIKNFMNGCSLSNEYFPVEYNYLETLAKILIIRARRNQFLQENIFNNAPVRRIVIAMNTNSAFTGSYTEYSFW